MTENNYPLLRHLQTEADKGLSEQHEVSCGCGWKGMKKQLKVNDSRRYCPSCLLPSNLKYNEAKATGGGHPCKGCKAYNEPNRPQGRMNCPLLDHQIALEGCNRICGATPKQAWAKIKYIREELKADEEYCKAHDC